MRASTRILHAAAVILCAGLACNLPNALTSPETSPDDVAASPTASVTESPTESPPELTLTAPAEEATAQTLRTTAKKIAYSSSVEGSCAAAQEVILSIRADGAAQMQLSGEGFVDYTNCTPSEGAEAWFIDGTVDFAAETVTFNSCNAGGFSASGQVSFAGGAVAGEVSCAWMEGSAAGKTAAYFAIP